MAERTINLRDLLILVADPSPFLCLLVHGMLRGFGANKVLEVRNSPGVLETLRPACSRVDRTILLSPNGRGASPNGEHRDSSEHWPSHPASVACQMPPSGL